MLGSLNFTTCSRWFEEGYNIEQPKIYGVLAVLREIGFTNMKNYHLDLYLPGGLSGNFFFFFVSRSLCIVSNHLC